MMPPLLGFSGFIQPYVRPTDSRLFSNSSSFFLSFFLGFNVDDISLATVENNQHHVMPLAGNTSTKTNRMNRELPDNGVLSYSEHRRRGIASRLGSKVEHSPLSEP